MSIVARGNAKARAALKYKPELYTPFALESWPDKDLRKEYSRLRDIAQKRIKRMQQFVVNFKIAKNITAPVGEKTIYVRILKPDDDVLVKNRSNLFSFEGKEINYSMKKIIEYEGEEVAVTLYWDIEEFLSPGTYRVDIFADGNHIGKKSFTLEE